MVTVLICFILFIRRYIISFNIKKYIMAKNKKKNFKEETLKHYTSYNKKDVPAGVPEPASDNNENNPPHFVKADISVDEIMSHRKNAVISNPQPEKDKEA